MNAIATLSLLFMPPLHDSTTAVSAKEALRHYQPKKLEKCYLQDTNKQQLLSFPPLKHIRVDHP